MEHIILSIISTYLDTNTILNPLQRGFRKRLYQLNTNWYPTFLPTRSLYQPVLNTNMYQYLSINTCNIRGDWAAASGQAALACATYVAVSVSTHGQPYQNKGYNFLIFTNTSRALCDIPTRTKHWRVIGGRTSLFQNDVY